MAAVLKVWRQVENPTLPIYSQNDSAKFHPDPIWKDGALGVFEERHSNNNKNNMISDIVSTLPGLKII